MKHEIKCDSLRANEIYAEKINGPTSTVDFTIIDSITGHIENFTCVTGHIDNFSSDTCHIDNFTCVTGHIDNFTCDTGDFDIIKCNNLYSATGINAKDITATGNISGATGSFGTISATGTIGANGNIFSSIGNISTVTGNISTVGGNISSILGTISGATGSFGNITATEGRFRNIEISHSNSNVIAPNNGGLYAYDTINGSHEFEDNVYKIITATGVKGGTIPVSSLLEGSTYEVYFSGKYSGNAYASFSTDLNLTFFSSDTNDTNKYFAPVNLNSTTMGTDTYQHFEVRFIFRIVSINSSQIMTITSTSTSIITSYQSSTLSVILTFSNTQLVYTPDRDSVNEFPINIQIKGNNTNAPIFIYDRNYYVRRIV
jgi:hypothetical protein